MPYVKVFSGLAALAAVLLAIPIPGSAQGWYMLTPPVVVRGAPAVNETAPLPQWRPSPLYESARACEEIRVKWVASLQRFETSLRRARALKARCIAATDPRLAAESASATAQTGWYLLTPPPRDEPRPLPSEQGGSRPTAEGREPAAPLVQWSHQRSFDSEAECEAARRDLGRDPDKGQGDSAGAQCISVSDRRLGSGATP